jgi:hypothetical protein
MHISEPLANVMNLIALSVEERDTECATAARRQLSEMLGGRAGREQAQRAARARWERAKQGEVRHG